MRRILMMALAGAAVVAAPAYATPTPNPPTLHGFCSSTAPCTDNNSHTPTDVNPPSFGFWASPGPASGTLLIDILVPNNVTLPTSYTFTGAYSGTATFFDANGAASGTPAWTTGDLASYLGLPDSGNTKTTPANPIDAYLGATQGYDSGATGFYVFQATIDSATLQSSGSDSNLMLLGQGLAAGSYITAFLGQNGQYGATAPSGAILETAPPVPEPATWAMMLLGFGGMGIAVRRSRRRGGALMQVA